MIESSACAIELSNLKFAYDKVQQPVIDIAHWQVMRGETVFLSGHSGSGKSTLLNLICGTTKPQSGSIRLLQQELSDKSSMQRDAFRARHLGVVFQQFNLIPYLSGFQNLQAAAFFAKRPTDDLHHAITRLCDTLALDESLLQQRADTLSVGQQQRVAIIRALINQPEILIADEPTSSLDANATQGFIDTLLKIVRAQGVTLLFVSHDDSLAKHFDRHQHLASFNQRAD